MTPINLRPLFLVTFAASLAFATSIHAAIAPAENLLPADTLAFFTVPDTAALRAALKTSPQAMFWNDPTMKPFHDKFMAKLNEKFTAPIEKDLGLKVADFLALPQGQLTLAVTANGVSGHSDSPPGILVLLDAKDQSNALKTNLAALTKKWTAAGRALRTETIHGLAFTVVPVNSNDFSGIVPNHASAADTGADAKPGKSGEVYFAQYQSLLVAGNSSKAVEAVAAHLTGGNTPAIADDATFASDKLAQFRDSPLYFGWFNGTKFINLMAPSDADSSTDDSSPSMMPKFTAAKIISATGLNGLKSASFAVRLTPDGSAMTVHLNAPESTRTGLLKILALSSKDASIPAFVPADAIKSSRFRLDGKQAWAELQKMIAGISPQGLSSLNAVIDMANTLAQSKDSSFDLRTALFGNLGDDIVIYGKAPVSSALTDLANPPEIYLIAVSNPDQVVNAIRNLAALAAPQDAASAPRNYLGHKIFSLAQRGKTLPDGSSAPASYLLVTTAGGYLVLGKNSSIIEEYLRSADGKLKPLRDNPAIADAASHVGGMSGGLFTYENQRETMRTAFKVLKVSAASDTTMKMFPPAMREWADFSLLPDYEPVAKYFYLSVIGGNANAEGLTLKIFTPRPPQLN